MASIVYLRWSPKTGQYAKLYLHRQKGERNERKEKAVQVRI